MERPFCGGLSQNQHCTLVHLGRLLNFHAKTSVYLLEGDCFSVQRVGRACHRRGLVSVLMPEALLQCYMTPRTLKINSVGMDMIYLSTLRLNSYANLNASMAALTCGLLTPAYFRDLLTQELATGGIHEVSIPSRITPHDGRGKNAAGPGAFSVVLSDNRSPSGGLIVRFARGEKKPTDTVLDEYRGMSFYRAKQFYSALLKKSRADEWQTMVASAMYPSVRKCLSSIVCVKHLSFLSIL